VYGIDYTYVLIIFNRLSKRKRVIPYKDILAEATVIVFLNKIFKHYGLETIFSNRGI